MFYLNKNYIIYPVLVVLIVLFHVIYSPNRSPITSYQTQQWIDEFYQIGKKFGTSKVSDHAYHHIYGAYLGPRRNLTLDLLEIGLGCWMKYGPGKSVLAWREYLPNARISIVEYDRVCAEKYRSKVEQMFIGDQSDFEFLKQVAQGGPYDVIIDDGGHRAAHQINSFIGLWPSVKSGGLYVVEDIHFWNDFNDGPEAFYHFMNKLMYFMIHRSKRAYPDPSYLGMNSTYKPILKTLLSINCFNQACVFLKK